MLTVGEQLDEQLAAINDLANAVAALRARFEAFEREQKRTREREFLAD